MENYESMLDEAYKELPEKAKTSVRFEIPTFKSFIQGNQTIVINFMEVVKYIRRDPKLLLKYLTRELAAPANVAGDRLIIKGKIREEQLNKKLKNFVKTYVICKECGKPDTELVTIEGVLYLRCSACGARYPIPPI